MKLEWVHEPTVLPPESAIFTTACQQLHKRRLRETGCISRGQKELESLSKVLRWNEKIDVSTNAVSGISKTQGSGARRTTRRRTLGWPLCLRLCSGTASEVEPWVLNSWLLLVLTSDSWLLMVIGLESASAQSLPPRPVSLSPLAKGTR